MEGGPAAYEPFVLEYGPYIYRTVFAVLRTPQDAEDVTQEVLLQIYRSLPAYRNEGLKTWMTRIAVNKAIDYKRYKARRPDMDAGDEAAQEESAAYRHGLLPTTEEQVLEREKRDRMRLRIAELPETYKEVVVAYYIEDKSYEQIAGETGLERKSVESRLYRARSWMKKHWQKEDFE
ncbi:RNA polymerase sigma factor [Paenibacillus protaetiae]|uniref:RNA polymerase sigma factor n=1 Tax=Paenibacillus protaetiae TaxID=2509456 RepID=UPI001FCA330E|nr:sigma-70 family RNA polymerase sigma factor [Paenibacillus protaetiae]